MSRSLGLREDQRWGESLVTRIIELLPVEPRWCYREQARSHMGLREHTKILWERACSR
jgi:hypothetical protein